MKKIINHTNGTMAMKLDANVKNQYEKVYNLAAGDPNLPVCLGLKEGLIQAAQDGIHQYGDAQGLYLLRSRIDDPDRVLIANGSKQIVYMALMSTCEPGDTVLLIGPCWSTYREICNILKLNVVQYIPFPDEKWHNDPFEIEKYFYKYKPNVVIFNNPNNPTGIIEGEYFVKGLIHLCEEHDAWLISDEVYSNFRYEGHFATAKNRSDNVIYINAFSKTYSITGWRLGYCIADPKLIITMKLLQSQMSGPPSTIIQHAVMNAMDSLDYYPISNAVMKARRDAIAATSPLLDAYKPQGGFYFYIPVNDSKQVCELYKQYNIILTPGDDYGVENTIRLSFANISLEDIEEIKPYLKLLS